MRVDKARLQVLEDEESAEEATSPFDLLEQLPAQDICDKCFDEFLWNLSFDDFIVRHLPPRFTTLSGFVIC